MNFVSYAFGILFIVALLARLTIGQNKLGRAYLGILLVLSLIFYSWHTPKFLILLIITTIIDFYCARFIDRSPSTFYRKFFLLISVISNIGVLVTFKYANFFSAHFIALFQAISSHSLTFTPLALALPIGISFYTFQAMSYTIDVYRNDLKPVKTYREFLFFVSFFPQLVAGPIVRAHDFIYQIPKKRRLRWSSFYEGSYLLIQGFFLKLVIADNLGNFVNTNWNRYIRTGENPTATLLLTFMFSCQIFCDFAGYSQIARGLGYLLGFKFPKNFNYPYIASSFTDFWKRWHISLSTWFRDYLYIPLGGNRCRKSRNLLNLLLVMLIAGLWHGAAENFLLWGLFFGLLLVIERGFDLTNRMHSAFSRTAYFVFVQICVLFSWILFRSQADDALFSVATLFHNKWHWVNWDLWQKPILFTVPVIFMHMAAFIFPRLKINMGHRSFQAVLSGVMLYFIFTYYATTNDFIYFQF